MEDQANAMMDELKTVVSTMSRQQEMIAGAVSQLQEQIRHTDSQANDLRIKQEHQLGYLRRADHQATDLRHRRE